MALFNKQAIAAQVAKGVQETQTIGTAQQGAPTVTDAFIAAATAPQEPAAPQPPLTRRQRGALAVLGGFNPGLLPATTQALASNTLGAFGPQPAQTNQLENLQKAAVADRAQRKLNDDLKSAELTRAGARVTQQNAIIQLGETMIAFNTAFDMEDNQKLEMAAFIANNQKALTETKEAVEAQKLILAAAGTSESRAQAINIDLAVRRLEIDIGGLTDVDIPAELKAQLRGDVKADFNNLLELLQDTGGVVEPPRSTRRNVGLITAKQAGDIGVLREQIDAVDELSSLISGIEAAGGKVGGFGALVRSLVPGGRALTDEETKVVAKLRGTQIGPRLEILGSQITQFESEFARPIFTNIGDDPRTIRASLDELKQFINVRLQGQLRGLQEFGFVGEGAPGLSIQAEGDFEQQLLGLEAQGFKVEEEK